MTTPEIEVLQARIKKLETRISNHTNLFIVLVIVAVLVAYVNSRPNKAMFVYNDAGDAVAWATVGIGSGPWIGLADPRGTVRAHPTAPVSGPFLALLGPEGLVTRDEDHQRLRLGWLTGDSLGLVIRDRAGRVRLELGLDAGGDPFFASYDASGTARSLLP